MAFNQLPQAHEASPFIDPKQYAEKLNGKVVVITGASVGIGRHVSKAFAAQGAHVACIARREAELNTLVDEIKADGGKAIPVVGDVAKRGAPKEIISKVESELGPVDVLINNAGITRIGPIELEDDDMETWWRVYEVNVRAPVSMIRAVLPSMLKRNSGTLITVSSNVATLNLPVMSAYNSSKAAISKFHEAITHELKDTGILSFAISPGVIESDLGKADGAINPQAMEHFAVKAFFATVAQHRDQGQTPEQPCGLLIALAADERYKALHGRHLMAEMDLEPVVKEAQKENLGDIGKMDLYKVRINAL